MPEFSTTPTPIASRAGIKRDGTQFEGEYYVDGQWCRFQRGLPRKIGGYRRLTDTLNGPPRELEIYSSGGFTIVHSGGPNLLERFAVDAFGNVGTVFDRTPAGFAANVNNDWQFAQVFDTADNQMKILAVATPSLVDIDQNVAFPLYVGDSNATAILTAVPGPTITTGGVVGLQSYAVIYGSDGTVAWSVSNNPDDFGGAGSGISRVTDQKIIVGLPLRGGGNSPAGLLWSLNSILRMSFVGGASIWQFDTLTSQSSILSANSVIEYDGVYYWLGIDRPLFFNGILQELENDLNLNFFYDNLNYNVRGKVFAFKVPRYGEIWWCMPLFGASEPNYAMIYNVRESRRLGYPVWYDTALPLDGRGAAHYPQNQVRPYMTSTTPNADNLYDFWWHEDPSMNELRGTSVLAIRSYFETADQSLLTADKPLDRALRVEAIEQDFVQTGDLICQISGRANARAPQVYSDPKTFSDVMPADAANQIMPFSESRRQLRYRYESNAVNGNYQMGKPIAHVAPVDGRRTS